jgi:hypothetical protein
MSATIETPQPVGTLWRTTARLGSVALVVALGAGCAPALDWREARIEGPGLLAMFPCRPVAQTREVALAGRQVSMRLHACEATGRTFAVMLADVADPAAVAPALLALRQASEAKTADAASHSKPVAWSAPPGATPQAVAGRLLLALPADGTPRSLQTALFARGTWVVQATAIGPRGGEELDAPFFDGLRFAP